MVASERFLLFHGFTEEGLHVLIKTCKKLFPDKDLVFAVTTETNMQWKVSELIEEVLKEHEYMKQQKGV